MLDAAEPEYVLLALLLLYIYSKMGRTRTSEIVCHSPLHWYHLLYTYLCYLLCSALHAYVVDIVVPSNNLDPEVVSNTTMREMISDNDTKSFAEWEKNASLAGWPVLRWWTLLSPVWVIATFLVCLYHIFRHGGRMRSVERSVGRRNLQWYMHDWTVRILLLPMVYGLMALHGVIYTLGAVCNVSEGGRFHSWHERREFFREMYEGCFYVGDIFESYALLIFGQVITEVIATKIQRSEVDGEALPRSNPELLTAVDLMDEVKELTTFGIKFFCWTCGLQALFQLICAGAGYYRIWEEIFGLEDPNGKHVGVVHTSSFQTKSVYFFSGAGFVSSFAAIGNIVKVETAFHRQLREFGPFWKFWGTKILVSIAYMQSTALYTVPPFSSWSGIRLKLLYGSVLCLECFLVSLLHLHAWSHDEHWYLSLSRSVGTDEEVGTETLTDDSDDAEDSKGCEQSNREVAHSE